MGTPSEQHNNRYLQFTGETDVLAFTIAVTFYVIFLKNLIQSSRCDLYESDKCIQCRIVY